MKTCIDTHTHTHTHTHTTHTERYHKNCKHKINLTIKNYNPYVGFRSSDLKKVKEIIKITYHINI